MPLKVGDKVEAIFNNNAFKKYQPGTIRSLRKGLPPGTGGNYLGAETNMVFWMLTGGWLWAPKKVFYDIDYDNGRLEQNVPEKLVRKIK
mmetsp:Transcript_22592/g.25158  ORF Transcript_22592/g.25158 Transcript_22592/m.25158 type:complete len:89 (+) Transcript_22592:41-307(+)